MKAALLLLSECAWGLGVALGGGTGPRGAPSGSWSWAGLALHPLAAELLGFAGGGGLPAPQHVPSDAPLSVRFCVSVYVEPV